MLGHDFSSLKASFLVLGANTGVGKTLISAGLCAALRRLGHDVLYVKPWQTGYPADSDAHTVEGAAPGTRALTIDVYPEPVSPHRASRPEGSRSDDAVLASLVTLVREAPGAMVVEGAGGVASPTPEGRLQCDVFRAVRMPVVLAGDPRLGGISATLSALEMLEARGFDVAAIVTMKGADENAAYLARHVSERSTTSTPRPRVVEVDDITPSDSVAMWASRNGTAFEGLASALLNAHFAGSGQALRARIEEEASRVWWPFTQHDLVSQPARIESALGDELRFAGEGPLFDACASWWTQCVGHADSRLVKAAARAAGRYGHVMFPENVHAPAAELARALVEGVGRGWAARVFFSDNGSTAVEVGLKMAFRLRLARLGREARAGEAIEVVGLRDSYHGDTIGVMDAASPNAFNAKEPWYRGRGEWYPFPTVRFDGAAWRLDEPDAFGAWCEGGTADDASFRDEAGVFSRDRDSSPRYSRYVRAVEAALSRMESHGRLAGAVLVEPLVHGSGGMLFVDPLFQRVLVRVAKARGIPVVYDEVFTGLWRVGFERAADALHEAPDVACYAKSLTGGLVPLGATLATREVFDAFRGGSKLEALLHGHSYSAYPVGCAVAVESLAVLGEEAAAGGRGGSVATGPGACSFVRETLALLARHPRVEWAWALGCVFAFALKEESGGGYGSQAAKETVSRLRAAGVYARPLGNVLYGVVSLTTPRTKADALLGTYIRVLDAET